MGTLTGLLGSPHAIGGTQVYVPTLTQGVTVAKTVDFARYYVLGRMVYFNVGLAVTGAGSASSQILMGLPLPSARDQYFGNGILNNQGVQQHNIACMNAGAGFQTVGFQWVSPTGTGMSLGNPIAPAFTLSNGDWIYVAGCYEAII
jgi:hypothetical protein